MTEAQRSELAARVSLLRERISRLRRRGDSIGEQDTKRVFVTPLLEVLGWDVQDFEEVRNEYRHRSQDNPVDYALFMLRTPCLFVEAKPMNASLEDRKWVSQTIGYAATVGVEWCVLTNGDEYRLYNAHAPVDADEKLFRAVRVADEQGEALTIETLDLLSKNKMQEKRLDVLWKAHFVDRRVRAALETLVHEQAPSLVRLLRKKTTGLTANDVRSSLKRADVQVGFPVSLTPPPEPVPRTPQNLRAGRKVSRGEDRKAERASYACTMKGLIETGLVKPPIELEATWRKQRFTATVGADGTLTFQGKTYHSLSMAGGMARNIASGPPSDGRPYYQTNGWTFWKYRDAETGKLELIDVLRQRYLKGRKTN